MSQDNDWFQILPTTGRTADTLARRHGYKNVTDLASSLPSHAEVLDVGAGASSLGRTIARLRPDVHWTNLDFSYHDERMLRDVSHDAPSNLTFIAGDATKLDHYIEPTSIDAVFSYWLFPHLSLYDRQTALTAAKQLYKAVKPGGILAIGPRKHPMLHPTSLRGGSWVIRKEKGLNSRHIQPRGTAQDRIIFCKPLCAERIRYGHI